MHHTHVLGQIALGAKMTPELLLACVMDGVYVAGEVGRASRQIDTAAFVRTCPAIAHGRR
jgi:hypothetical protein